MNSKIRKENNLCWFVMRCHDAEKIEAYIDKYNADALVNDNDKVEDLFIPSLAIKRRTVSRTADDATESDNARRKKDEDRKSNEMRNSMRRFVFLYVRPSAFDRLDNHLSTQYWNIGHTRLYHYRDVRGKEITVSTDNMNTFINGCLEYREKFEIRTKDSQITEGLQVTVRNGAFKDFKAEVYNVHYKASGIRFSIAIKFFANDKYVYIHDRRPEDVILEEQDAIVFNSDFIERMQTAILDILSRKVNKKETEATRKTDSQQLRQLYAFRHAIIDDTLRSLQLDALMSMCASLSKNTLERSKYNKRLRQQLRELPLLALDDTTTLVARAYLLTALYVSTKDAAYRNELKLIVRQQLPDHQLLNRFLSLIKKI